MKKIYLITAFIVFVTYQNNNLCLAQKTKISSNKIVLITTKYGNIKIKLFDETPLHRDNFIKLAESHYLDSTLFHRVINKFMIQGGDPDSKYAKQGTLLGNGGPGYTIPAEFRPKLFHKKGVLAAAREGDNINPQKASSGSQFYIVQGKVFSKEELNIFAKNTGKTFTPEQINAYTTIGGTPHLDGSYTVFGEIISGLEVLDKISAVKTDKNNRPIEDIRMFVKIISK